MTNPAEQPQQQHTTALKRKRNRPPPADDQGESSIQKKRVRLSKCDEASSSLYGYGSCEPSLSAAVFEGMRAMKRKSIEQQCSKERLPRRLSKDGAEPNRSPRRYKRRNSFVRVPSTSHPTTIDLLELATTLYNKRQGTLSIT